MFVTGAEVAIDNAAAVSKVAISNGHCTLTIQIADHTILWNELKNYACVVPFVPFCLRTIVPLEQCDLFTNLSVILTTHIQ